MVRAALPIAVLALAAAACVSSDAAQAPAADRQDQEAQAVTSPLAVALDMVQAWNDLDVDRIVALFAEDGVLHSMMLDEPTVGRDAIRARLAALLDGATRLELQIVNTAVTGNVVFLERVDDFDFRGRHGRTPVVGVLVIEDGLVAAWREYYDRNQLLSELGLVERIAY